MPFYLAHYCIDSQALWDKQDLRLHLWDDPFQAASIKQVNSWLGCTSWAGSRDPQP